MRPLRIAMAQINPTVGDIAGNTRLIQTWIKEARRAKADLVAFPELAVTGYPPEDLLFKPRFIEDTQRALKAVAAEARGLVVVVGYVGQGATAVSASEAPSFPLAGRHELYNEAAVLSDRRILATYRKRHLPNYGVFDESRYFRPRLSPAAAGPERRDDRGQYLRRHLVFGRAHAAAGLGRRRGHRQYQRIPVPCREGTDARTGAGDQGP